MGSDAGVHQGDPGVWVNPSVPSTRRRGVVIVHGVGGARKSDMLLDVAEPIVDWLNRWYRANDPAAGPPTESDVGMHGGVHLRPVLSFAPADIGIADRPSTTSIELPESADAEDSREWLLSEAWWAGSVRHASFSAMLDWLVENWRTLISYALFIALGRSPLLSPPEAELHDHWFVRIVETINGLALMVALVVAFVPGIVLLLLLHVLGLIPIAPLQALLAGVQPFFVVNFGEFRLYLQDEVVAANMRRRIYEAVEIIAPYCDQITIVAYSEGAVAAHGMLSDPVYTNAPNCQSALLKVRKFVTVGAALNKSWQLCPELERLRRRIMPHIYWVNIWGTYDVASTGWLVPPHRDDADKTWTVRDHDRWVYTGQGDWARIFQPGPRVQNLLRTSQGSGPAEERPQARPGEPARRARESDYEFVGRLWWPLLVPVVVGVAEALRLLGPQDQVRGVLASLEGALPAVGGVVLLLLVAAGVRILWVALFQPADTRRGRFRLLGRAIWTCTGIAVLSGLVLTDLDGGKAVAPVWLIWLPILAVVLVVARHSYGFGWFTFWCFLLACVGVLMTFMVFGIAWIVPILPITDAVVPARWLTLVPVGIATFLAVFMWTHRGVWRQRHGALEPRETLTMWWPRSIAVHNQMHPLLDHLKYWDNDEGVIGRLVAEIDRLDATRSRFRQMTPKTLSRRSIRVAELTAAWAALNVLALVWIVPPLPGAQWTAPGGIVRAVMRATIDNLPLGLKVESVRAQLRSWPSVPGVTLDELLAVVLTVATWFLLSLLVFELIVRPAWARHDLVARENAVHGPPRASVPRRPVHGASSRRVVVAGRERSTRTAPPSEGS
jgi:hypothetical protein